MITRLISLTTETAIVDKPADEDGHAETGRRCSSALLTSAERTRLTIPIAKRDIQKPG